MPLRRFLFCFVLFCFLVETGFHHIDQPSLKLQTSGDLPTSASQSAGITGMSRCSWPTFLFFFFKTGFCHVGQVGLKRLTSGDPPASASQSVGITGVSHRAHLLKRKKEAGRDGSRL